MVKHESLTVNRTLIGTGVFFLVSLLLISGCQLTPDSAASSDRLRFFDGVTGKEAALKEMVEDLSNKDVSFSVKHISTMKHIEWKWS